MSEADFGVKSAATLLTDYDELVGATNALNNLAAESCGAKTLRRVTDLIAALTHSKELARVVEDAADVVGTAMNRLRDEATAKRIREFGDSTEPEPPRKTVEEAQADLARAWAELKELVEPTKPRPPEEYFCDCDHLCMAKNPVTGKCESCGRKYRR